MMSIETAYRKFAMQVHRRCLRLLGNEAEAEDATHEVFLRAVDRLPEPEEEAMAWLYRVSTNYCLNTMRNRSMRDRKSWQDGVREVLSRGGPNPETTALQRDLTLCLLEEHDPETQAIAVYYYVDGMSQGEIAKVVGLARGTVNRKLQAFARRCSERLEEVER